MPVTDTGGSGNSTQIAPGTGPNAAVKPASTAPLATDPALVVTLSPNGSSTTPLGTVSINQTTPGTTNGVSLNQINGTTLLGGAGAAATGSPRVTVAQDTTTIAGSAPGTAGTPSVNVVSVQGVLAATPVAVGAPTPGLVWTGLISVTGTHNAGSSVGGLQPIPVARISGGAGWINQISMNSTAGATNQIVFRVYKSTPAGGSYVCTDGTALTDTAAARALLITPPFAGTLTAPASTTGDATTYTTQQGVWWPFVTSGNTNVYVCAVTVANDTTDPASTVMFGAAAVQSN